jgi:protein-S-isoprenylcysteine O-methyltransferase Ste14
VSGSNEIGSNQIDSNEHNAYLGAAMGRRGELWVIAQAVLLILFLAAPQLGPAWPQADVFRVIGWMFAIGGTLLFAGSALKLGRSFTPFPRPRPEARLVTTGVYRMVRHPIYLAALLVCLGLALATTSPLRLALTLVLFVFFDMKARREEGWLQERYPAYAAYKMRVKKLIPWIY